MTSFEPRILAKHSKRPRASVRVDAAAERGFVLPHDLPARMEFVCVYLYIELNEQQTVGRMEELKR